MLDHLSRRYGHRGTWLIVLGCVWVFFGVGMLLNREPPRSWVLLDYLPALVEACAWWLTGAIAIIEGLRGPDRSDWRGHVALYLMPALRLICFALSWVIWVGSSIAVDVLGVHAQVIGWRDGWYAALVWLLVSVMLRLPAGWPNPSRPIPHPPADVNGEN